MAIREEQVEEQFTVKKYKVQSKFGVAKVVAANTVVTPPAWSSATRSGWTT
jgi:hypothetical protein